MENMYIQGCRALVEGNRKEATACFDKIVLSSSGGPDVAHAEYVAPVGFILKKPYMSPKLDID